VKFAALLLSNAQISNQVVGTETLINNICEESKWLKNHHARNQQGQGGNKKDGQANYQGHSRPFKLGDKGG
jgi:hypothetical protein